MHAGRRVYRRYLWWPRSTHRFVATEQQYKVTASLYPICQFSLYAITDGGTEPVQQNLFPKLRSRSLVFFITGPIRHSVMIIAATFS